MRSSRLKADTRQALLNLSREQCPLLDHREHLDSRSADVCEASRGLPGIRPLRKADADSHVALLPVPPAAALPSRANQYHGGTGRSAATESVGVGSSRSRDLNPTSAGAPANCGPFSGRVTFARGPPEARSRSSQPLCSGSYAVTHGALRTSQTLSSASQCLLRPHLDALRTS